MKIFDKNLHFYNFFHTCHIFNNFNENLWKITPNLRALLNSKISSLPSKNGPQSFGEPPQLKNPAHITVTINFISYWEDKRKVRIQQKPQLLMNVRVSGKYTRTLIKLTSIILDYIYQDIFCRMIVRLFFEHFL